MASKTSWTPQVPICSPQQEQMLRELREQRGIESWKKIACILNQSKKEFTKTAKQYRDRYVNYIRFNDNFPKIMEWSKKQSVAFLEKYFDYGAKWVRISLEMEGRSENNLKNKFYGLMRKVTRRVQNYEKKLKPKPKKLTNEKYIIGALDEYRKVKFGKCFNLQAENQFDLSAISVKAKMIQFLTEMGEESSNSSIQEFIGMMKRIKCPIHRNSFEKKSNSPTQQSNSQSSSLDEQNRQFQETHEEKLEKESSLTAQECQYVLKMKQEATTHFDQMENIMNLTHEDKNMDLLDELCFSLDYTSSFAEISLLN